MLSQLLAAVLLVAPVATPTEEAGQGRSSGESGQVLAGADDDAVLIDGWRSGRTEVGEAASAQGESASAPSFEYTHVPACPGNTPNIEGADAGCAQAEASCPDDAVMYWLFRRQVGGTGPWETAGSRCLAPSEAAATGPVFPGFTLADFQRLPLPAGTPNVQPDNGYTLVGVPTNVYATAEPVTLDTQLLGFPVQVRATPSRYAWDFGDGNGHGPTSEPGAPYPALTITHTYERAARYPITLTTYYRGEYSVAGGPWLPIAGEAQVTSAPVDVEALAGRNRLVADPQG